MLLSNFVFLREAWGPHIDLWNPRFLAFTAAERRGLQSEYEDYAVATSRSITCFRSVAVIVSIPTPTQNLVD